MSWHKWFISEGKNLFIPHRDTHKKAHLISWHGIAIYILIFIILQSGLSIFSYSHPGVLGTTANIQAQRLVELTNAERAKVGLAPLTENSSLDQAASGKAANMFEENYWAHFAPSGKTPWDFISGAGYRFTFAGENLAKNFTSADDVVAAWMASPSHRENILNPKYREIGFAVEDGVLQGNSTTLVVQMFGSSATTALAAAPANPTVAGQPTTAPSAQPTRTPTSASTQPVVVVGGQQIPVPQEDLESPRPLALLQPITAVESSRVAPLFNPITVTKTYGLGIIGLMAVLLVVDVMVLRHRGVYRITSHHIAHLSILGVAAATLIASSGGSIL